MQWDGMDEEWHGRNGMGGGGVKLCGCSDYSLFFCTCMLHGKGGLCILYIRCLF